MSNLVSQLTEQEVVLGKYILNQYGLNASGVSAPITLTSLRGIQDITFDPEESTEKVFHQGGGMESLELTTEIRWSGQMQITGGQISQIATLLGLTMGASGQYGIPHRQNRLPKGFISRRIYKNDGSTLIGVELLIDIKIGHIPVISGGIDLNNLVIPIYSEWSPYFLVDAEPVYDKFSADGTMTEFILSSDPVKIETASNSQELVNDYAFFVKIKGSGDTVGTRQTTDFSITPETKTLSFTSAPAEGSEIEVLYAKAAS